MNLIVGPPILQQVGSENKEAGGHGGIARLMLRERAGRQGSGFAIDLGRKPPPAGALLGSGGVY